jgi:hypothetical protein
METGEDPFVDQRGEPDQLRCHGLQRRGREGRDEVGRARAVMERRDAARLLELQDPKSKPIAPWR